MLKRLGLEKPRRNGTSPMDTRVNNSAGFSSKSLLSIALERDCSFGPAPEASVSGGEPSRLESESQSSFGGSLDLEGPLTLCVDAEALTLVLLTPTLCGFRGLTETADGAVAPPRRSGGGCGWCCNGEETKRGTEP